MPAETLPFHLTIGSRFENIELVQAVLSDALSAYELGEESRHWIDLAVREAVANAIKHGNRLEVGKRVEIDLELTAAELIVRVRDQGEGFDPGGVTDPLAPENRLRPNGRGLFYMQKFMDEIDYEFQPGRGMEVTLRKRLAPGPDGAGEASGDAAAGGKVGSSDDGSR
jgi:serine/threonine-protein kinase RsbW